MGLFDGQPFSMERAADNMMSPLGLAAQNLARFDSGGIDMGAAAGRAQMYHQDKENQNKTRAYLEMNNPELLPLLDSGASPAELLGRAFNQAQQQKQEAAEQQRREQLAQFITDPAGRAAFLAGEGDFADFRGKPPEDFTLGAGETRYAGDGAVLAQGAPDQQDQFGNEKDLFAQYSGSDPVKAYETVKGGYERVRQSSALQTGAGDMGLIYGYMKMLDPGSVVRESEFAMAAQAGSYGEQIQGLVSRLVNGERLPESVRQQFVQAADQIYQETAGNLTDINSQFSTRAQRYGLDPNVFIRQPEQYQPTQGIITMPNGNTVKPL